MAVGRFPGHRRLFPEAEDTWNGENERKLDLSRRGCSNRTQTDVETCIDDDELPGNSLTCFLWELLHECITAIEH